MCAAQKNIADVNLYVKWNKLFASFYNISSDFTFEKRRRSSFLRRRLIELSTSRFWEGWVVVGVVVVVLVHQYIDDDLYMWCELLATFGSYVWHASLWVIWAAAASTAVARKVVMVQNTVSPYVCLFIVTSSTLFHFSTWVVHHSAPFMSVRGLFLPVSNIHSTHLQVAF